MTNYKILHIPTGSYVVWLSQLDKYTTIDPRNFYGFRKNYGTFSKIEVDIFKEFIKTNAKMGYLDRASNEMVAMINEFEIMEMNDDNN
jgi:hypothetical protein